MKKIALLLAVPLLFTNCKKEEDVDTTKPVISISTPTQEQEIQRGTKFMITGTITDDKELASFKIDIHDGSGHTHKSTISGENEWDHEITKSISGTSYSISEEVTIPVTADTAEYDIIIEALDKAGNAASFIELEIDVIP